MISAIPDWVRFPDLDEEMPAITPEEAGLDVARWNAWLAEQNPYGEGYGGDDHSGDRWGAVLARGGCVIQTWGHPGFQYQTASVGKCFTRMVLQLAVDEGLIGSANDLIKNYWTGEDQLNGRHKYLNQGHHNTLTFSHLANMFGGFPVTDTYSWVNRLEQYPGVPSWANWTGDSDYDNYAHTAPRDHDVCYTRGGHWSISGKLAAAAKQFDRDFHYSSGGYWRLSQALTAIWNKDIKQVLDEKIMSKIGIRADAWEWLPGKVVHDDLHPLFRFYPDRPDYGLYIDPPYEINGYVVRVGPGCVVMNARQLARVGLLIATGGWCNGKRLISDLEGFHSVNGITSGTGVKHGTELYCSWGGVATKGLDFDNGPPPDLFVGPMIQF